MANKATPLDTGGQKLRWPRNDEDVLAQMEIYAAHEQSLPPAEQLQDISLAVLESVWTEAKEAQAAFKNNEAERVKAAATYRPVLKQTQDILRRVRKVLEARYLDDVSPMVDWGFETRLSRHKPIIILPDTVNKWRALLDSYIAHESALPETERVANPAYETVTALQQTLHDSLRKREEAQANRETAVATRRAAVRQLKELLKLAAWTRIHLYYGGQISPDLQLWGYHVVVPSSPASGAASGSES